MNSAVEKNQIETKQVKTDFRKDKETPNANSDSEENINLVLLDSL